MQLISVNHNETVLSGLRVNHNQTVLSGMSLNHNETALGVVLNHCEAVLVLSGE